MSDEQEVGKIAAQEEAYRLGHVHRLQGLYPASTLSALGSTPKEQLLHRETVERRRCGCRCLRYSR